MPYLEEKENGESSDQSSDSSVLRFKLQYSPECTKPMNKDLVLPRSKRQGHLSLLKQNRDHKRIPSFSLSDVIHKQNSEVGVVVCSPRAGKSFICSICNKQFKYYSNLKSHLEIIHKRKMDCLSEEMKSPSTADWSNVSFQCEVCLRDFKYASNLRTHRLVHTGQDTQE